MGGTLSGGSHRLLHVRDAEPGYPPPQPPLPPLQRRSAAELKLDLEAVDALSRKISVTKTSTYEQLVRDITFGLKSDIQSMRAILAWIGRNKIQNMEFPEKVDPCSPLGYMKMINHGERSVTSLYVLMCRFAHLPAVILRGCGKGGDFEVGDTDLSNYRQTWAAIHGEGQWWLVHPEWALTPQVRMTNPLWRPLDVHVDLDPEVISKDLVHPDRDIHDDFFFMTDPELFAFLCLPDDSEPEWQLQEKPWSESKFANAPRFTSRYFSCGHVLTSPMTSRCYADENGLVVIRFGHAHLEYPTLLHALFFHETASRGRLPPKSLLTGYVLEEHEPSARTLYIRCPTNGFYKLCLFGSKTGELPLVCDFSIIWCGGLTRKKYPFPRRPCIGFGSGPVAVDAGVKCVNHPGGVIHAGVGEEVRIRLSVSACPESIQATVYHTHISCRALQRYLRVERKDKSVHLLFTVPNVHKNKEYGLEVDLVREEKDHRRNVFNFLITAYIDSEKHRKAWFDETPPDTNPPPLHMESMLQDFALVVSRKSTDDSIMTDVWDHESIPSEDTEYDSPTSCGLYDHSFISSSIVSSSNEVHRTLSKRMQVEICPKCKMPLWHMCKYASRTREAGPQSVSKVTVTPSTLVPETTPNTTPTKEAFSQNAFSTTPIWSQTLESKGQGRAGHRTCTVTSAWGQVSVKPGGPGGQGHAATEENRIACGARQAEEHPGSLAASPSVDLQEPAASAVLEPRGADKQIFPCSRRSRPVTLLDISEDEREDVSRFGSPAKARRVSKNAQSPQGVWHSPSRNDWKFPGHRLKDKGRPPNATLKSTVPRPKKVGSIVRLTLRSPRQTTVGVRRRGKGTGIRKPGTSSRFTSYPLTGANECSGVTRCPEPTLPVQQSLADTSYSSPMVDTMRVAKPPLCQARNNAEALPPSLVKEIVCRGKDTKGKAADSSSMKICLCNSAASLQRNCAQELTSCNYPNGTTRPFGQSHIQSINPAISNAPHSRVALIPASQMPSDFMRLPDCPSGTTFPSLRNRDWDDTQRSQKRSRNQFGTLCVEPAEGLPSRSSVVQPCRRRYMEGRRSTKFNVTVAIDDHHEKAGRNDRATSDSEKESTRENAVVPNEEDSSRERCSSQMSSSVTVSNKPNRKELDTHSLSWDLFSKVRHDEREHKPGNEPRKNTPCWRDDSTDKPVGDCDSVSYSPVVAIHYRPKARYEVEDALPAIKKTLPAASYTDVVQFNAGDDKTRELSRNTEIIKDNSPKGCVDAKSRRERVTGDARTNYESQATTTCDATSKKVTPHTENGFDKSAGGVEDSLHSTSELSGSLLKRFQGLPEKITNAEAGDDHITVPQTELASIRAKFNLLNKKRRRTSKEESGDFPASSDTPKVAPASTSQHRVPQPCGVGYGGPCTFRQYWLERFCDGASTRQDSCPSKTGGCAIIPSPKNMTVEEYSTWLAPVHLSASETALAVARLHQDVEDLEVQVTKYLHKHGLTTDVPDPPKTLHLAQSRLIQLYLKDLHESLEAGNVDRLDWILAAIDNSVMAEKMAEVILVQRAHKALRCWRMLQLLQSHLARLTLATLAEMVSYYRVSPDVMATMRATYLLLGEPDTSMQDWVDIRRLMREVGRRGLLYRMGTFDFQDLSEHAVVQAARLVNRTKAANVEYFSRGASVFYHWCRDVIKGALGDTEEICQKWSFDRRPCTRTIYACARPLN